jgi:hypothetical protein
MFHLLENPAFIITLVVICILDILYSLVFLSIKTRKYIPQLHKCVAWVWQSPILDLKRNVYC